jgi:hypothetical protein
MSSWLNRIHRPTRHIFKQVNIVSPESATLISPDSKYMEPPTITYMPKSESIVLNTKQSESESESESESIVLNTKQSDDSCTNLYKIEETMLLEEIISIIKSYGFNFKELDYKPIPNAMGIGDLLWNIVHCQDGLFSIPLHINVFFYTNNMLYPNSKNALIFRLDLLNDILSNHTKLTKDDIVFYYNNNKNEAYYQNYKYSALTSFKIQSNIRFPFISDNEEYIVFHTKLRLAVTATEKDYTTVKNNILSFCNTFKSKYKIYIVGEREMPKTYESIQIGITTIYNELLTLSNNNTVVDLSEDIIYNNLNYNTYKHDIALFRKAKYNIICGFGGQLSTLLTFCDNIIHYNTACDILISDISSNITLNNYNLFINFELFARFLNSNIGLDRTVENSKICIFIHFGLGDLICMIPAITYLSNLYSEVKIACLEKNINNLNSIFKNNNKITYLIHDKLNIKNSTHSEVSLQYSDIYPVDETKYDNELFGYDIMRCGLHKYLYEKMNNLEKSDAYLHNQIPFDFYRQMGIPYSIFWTNFTAPEIKSDSLMYTLDYCMKSNNIKSYIFVHNITGDNVQPILNSTWIKTKYNFNPETTLFINPNINMYSHISKFYYIANSFLNRPILEYTNIIRNASGLFLTNSSFFCLALHLDIKTRYKFVVARSAATMEYIWDPIYGSSNINNKFNIIYNINDVDVDKTLMYNGHEENCISYISGGRLGDFIYQLGIIYAKYIATGKKGILYIADIGDKFQMGVEQAYNDTKELVLSQPYIEQYSIYTGEKYEYDLSKWRELADTDKINNRNWFDIFSDIYKVDFGKSSWLQNIPTNPDFIGKILVSSSLLRSNKSINIANILSNYDISLCHFICFDSNEYIQFIQNTKIVIPHTIYKNTMEMAIAINSCKLFICNFSAPCCIALALHKPIIAIAPSDPKHDIDITLIKGCSDKWNNLKVIY